MASVNKFAISEMDKLIKNLVSPPSVISKFKTKVFQTEFGAPYFDISDAMATYTYTHVPVWKTKIGNKYNDFVGVLSYNTVFEWFVNYYMKHSNGDFSEFNEPIFIEEINKKYLNSPVVHFDFIEEKKNIYEIPPIWDKYTKQRKRLDCLLITKNGIKGEQITGIITSWDLGAI